MKREHSDLETAKKVTGHLDRSLERIDDQTLERLRRGRLAALAQRPGASRWQLFPWLTPARLSFALTTMLLALMLFALVPGQRHRSVPGDDLEVLTSGEQVEMIEDLDFYRWLAAGGSKEELRPQAR